MPNDIVSDVPRGNLTMRYTGRPLRQPQPGAARPETLGVSNAVPYPERTRQLRRAVQRKARTQVAGEERTDDGCDDDKS